MSAIDGVLGGLHARSRLLSQLHTDTHNPVSSTSGLLKHAGHGHGRSRTLRTLTVKPTMGPAASEHLSTWHSTRASGCALTNQRVVFMLTSTPPRARRVGIVLENMRAQTRRPDCVLLSLPRTYLRPPFRSLKYELASSIAKDPLLQIHYVDHDAGPLTKYFGVEVLTNSSDIVIVGDDDVWYDSTFIEDFACAVASDAPGVVFSSGRDGSCGATLGACVMGFRGVGMRASMLRQTPTLRVPAACFLADDVLITHHFRTRGFQIKKLRTRNRYRIDGKYAWSNDSINVIHSRHDYKMNLECVNWLLEASHFPPRKIG